MNRDDFTFAPPRRAVTVCLALAALGGVALAAGLVLAPREALANLLLAGYYVLGLSLGAAVLTALLYVTGAGWGVALRRVPEALAAALPVGAALVVAALLAAPALYPWAEAGHAEGEHGSPLRDAWLSWPFLLARAAVYLACWYALILALVRNSRRQDADGDLAHTRRNVRLSAAFLVVFAATFWLASYDWVMSLEPHWYSTMFGLYNFAGLFLGGIAAVVLVTAWLRRGPLRRVVTADHLHDLGRLLFAFSTFWVYLWYCQYMLIWYVNNPEETVYYVRRQEGAWQPLLLAAVVLNWAVPFLVLLPRSAKRNAGVLVKVALAVLVGRWLDLYLMIAPPVGEPAGLGVVGEAAVLLGALGLFGLGVLGALRKAPLVPVRDPLLVESLPPHATERVTPRPSWGRHGS
jgi:hypothetical protein